MFHETIFRKQAAVPEAEATSDIAMNTGSSSPFPPNSSIFRQQDRRSFMEHCRDNSCMGIVSECSFAAQSREDSMSMEEDDDDDVIVCSFRSQETARTQAVAGTSSSNGDESSSPLNEQDEPLTMLLTFSMSQSFDSADQELDGGSTSLCDSFEQTTQDLFPQLSPSKDLIVSSESSSSEQENMNVYSLRSGNRTKAVPDYKNMTERQRQLILKSLYQRK